MVLFRDFTQRKATRLGLVGTVQNIDNGSVVVSAEGEDKKLHELLKLLHKGPMFSRVEHVEDIWKQPTGEFYSFSIVY